MQNRHVRVLSLAKQFTGNSFEITLHGPSMLTSKPILVSALYLILVNRASLPDRTRMCGPCTAAIAAYCT